MEAHPDTRTNRRAGHVINERTLPVATYSFLADCEKLVASHTPEQVNQPLVALVRARKAIGDARLACMYAKKLHKGNEAVCERLDAIGSACKDMLDQFPLDVH